MSTEFITRLREMTGAGIMDCRNALKESDNDIDKACQILREKGIVSAVKRAVRSVKH
jgi:elongation factor Ts